MLGPARLCCHFETTRRSTMSGIVGPEIIVLIVVLAWRGPSSLPRLGESLGKAVKGVRDNMPSATKGQPHDPPGPDDPQRPA